MLTSSPSGRSWQLPLGTQEGTGDEQAAEFPGLLEDTTAVTQSAVLHISEGAAPALFPPPQPHYFPFLFPDRSGPILW